MKSEKIVLKARHNVDNKPVVEWQANSGTCISYVDYCPHRGGPISEGVVVDGRLTCPWHGSQFDLYSGQCLKGPATKPLQKN